ncbi:DUF58 domain-containing protein [Lysobacter sp. Root494]|uniref:DUF58 domain-containing protein n=1 Tax=Lysobacter sp. Root494 TaxID=1736549 RepID=UPI0006FA0AEC|nr:DUF58 domain-containing protein [Lysobacter sp. Root494]KQY54772.1 hypothetical protein ASD14_00880 [Lysobacter sp. Root494]
MTQAATPSRSWPRPAPAMLVLLVLWAAFGLAASIAFVAASVWQAAGIALLLLAAFDARRVMQRATPDVQRRVPDTWPIGVERPVTLKLVASNAQRVDIFDLHPGSWAMQGLPRRLQLQRGEATTLDYSLRANARGDFTFDGVQLRLYSPWRLWWQSRVAGDAQRVRVFPNFAPLARFAMFSAEQASRLVGAHVKRRRGEGTDFHQMREYRVGDSLRQVDWKATARARRLISREYQDEKNQQLVLLLDTGRRLLARDGELAHFDHVLDAALVVSYLALRQGDGVGLLASGGDTAWVPPQRGVGAIDNLLRATYALQPKPVATDFLQAATELSLRQRRRALVMLVTNLRDEDMDDLLAAVQMLRKRHLVCVASLREEALDATLAQDVHDLPTAIRAGATAEYLAKRNAAHDALRSHGVMVLDVACAQLAASLVEKYLAIKRDGLL